MNMMFYEQKGLERNYCGGNLVLLFHFYKDFETQTGLMNCTFSHGNQKSGGLSLSTVPSKQCLGHCRSGVWEPQDPKVIHEQETVAFTQFKYCSIL